MAMTDSDYPDLINLTRKRQVQYKLQDLAANLRFYESKRMIKDEASSFDSGAVGWEWRVLLNYAGSARMVGTRTPDVYNQVSGTDKLTFPWRQMNDNWVINKIDMTKNSEPDQIFALVKAVRAMQQGSTATLVEGQMWSKPTSSADTLSFWGIPMHLVANATTGFNGGNPSGFADYGGLDRATYARLRNYTGLYTSVTKPDLINTLRIGGVSTRWQSPTDLDQVAAITNQYRSYCNTATWAAMCQLAENQNDNLGGEMTNYTGNGAYNLNGAALSLFGNPVIPVPALDGTTSPTNPIYCVNWATLMIKFLSGWMMREGDAHIVPFNHLEIATDVDTVFNMGCVDPSQNMVLCTAA